jgi:hypothetical protein
MATCRRAITFFKIRAMNGDGYWSKEFNYSFSIRPPCVAKPGGSEHLWELPYFFCSMVFTAGEQPTLRRQKRILEQTVKERTAEVVEEKAEV